jgi:hypothetical protein
MALQNSDLFYVQRGADSHKMQASQLIDFIASSPTINYRGTVDATAAPAGQLNPATPVAGDLYINTATGTVAAGWTGIVGDAIQDGQRVIYDGSNWAIVGTAAGAAVETVSGTAPIAVDSSDPENVVVSITEATNAAFGSTRLAQDPPGAGNLTSTADTDVLSVPHFNELAGRITTAAAGGTQDVVGVDPIEASQDAITHVASVSIKDASVSQKGAATVQTTVAAGQDAHAAVGSTAVIAYSVPLNLSTLTELA